MTNDNQETVVHEIDQEQAQEFASLNALAGDQVIPGAPVEEEKPEGIPLSVQISGLLGMAVNIAGPMFPSLATIYTPEVIQAVGAALEPVCNKHGWLQDGIDSKWGEEIAALCVVGPIAYATYMGIQSDIAARTPSKPPEQLGGTFAAPVLEAIAPTTQAGSNTVTVGALIQ